MSTPFIGIYKAVYDYELQNDEELAIKEDDLLYLLETSDVDDWWKVKKRVVGAEAEEPLGLVPSNYIEPAPVVSSLVALYDYDKQTDEELSFKEGLHLDVYDTSDQDWILVGIDHAQFGFVPANYIEIGAATLPQALPQAFALPPAANSASSAQYGSLLAASSFLPPPQRVSENPPQVPLKDEPQFLPQPSQPVAPVLTQQLQNDFYDERDDDAEEEAPPMPSRPRPTASAAQDDDFHGGSTQELFIKDDFFTWPVQEIDTKGKKTKNTLGVGNATIYLSPEASSGATPRQWKVHNLLNFSNEKKHVFLEFEKPYANIELHAGSKDSLELIVSILGDIKGAISMKGLQEVKALSVPSKANGHKTGRIIFDFEAATEDELTVRENDVVYIINDSKSKDWWMVENMDSGEQGVIPSNYVEVNKSMRRSSSNNLLSKVGQRVVNPNKKKKREREREKLRAEHDRRERELEKELERERRRTKRERELRNREERERVRRHDDRERLKLELKLERASAEKEDKSKPNPHRVRTWIDRSGSFKVEAEFLGCVDGKIHLHKTNGVKIAVAAPKLSTEDLEYIEKVTGMSLENYKQKAKPKEERVSSNSNTNSNSNSNSKSSARPQGSAKDPDYDWFEFFLNCGVDVNNCQRYQLNFNREQMDENILEDITPSLLRTLGLREGDILRVMKFLDAKFDRKSGADEPAAGAKSGIFQTSNGNLSTDRLATSDKVDGSKLSPVKGASGNSGASGLLFEDDAWAVKPAVQTGSQMDLTSQHQQPPQRPSSVPTQHLNGSISDLISLKPMGTGKAAPAPQPQATNAAAPALQPLKTGPGSLASDNQTFTPLYPQKTSGTLGAQLTGGAGLLTAQPTGFVPIGNFIPTQITGGFLTLQATGLIPLQATGGLIPLQKTGGLVTAQPTGSFIPLQRTGLAANATGLLPLQPTGGLVPLQKTGNLAMPTTSFGLIPSAPTGGLTGIQSPQKTGGFVPQTSFGQMLVQKTGGNLAMPATSFGQVQPQLTSFGQIQPQLTSFGQIQPQQTSFGQIQPQLTSFGQIQPQQTSFNQFPALQPQQTSFNQFAPLQPQQTSFNAQQQFPPLQQQQQPQLNQFQPQQTSFGMNGLTNMFQNTSISPSPMPQQFPTTSFGNQFGASQPLQPQLTSFGVTNQPLQAQPTGFGFGNGGGLQPQKTGRANLANATPDNPFGF